MLNEGGATVGAAVAGAVVDVGALVAVLVIVDEGAAVGALVGMLVAVLVIVGEGAVVGMLVAVLVIVDEGATVVGGGGVALDCWLGRQPVNRPSAANLTKSRRDIPGGGL